MDDLKRYNRHARSVRWWHDCLDRAVERGSYRQARIASRMCYAVEHWLDNNSPASVILIG